MLRERYTMVRQAAIIVDAFIVILAFLAAFYLRQHFHDFYKLDLFPTNGYTVPPSALSLSDYLLVLFIVTFLWCFTLYFNGMYRYLRTKTLFDALWIIIKSAFLTVFFFGTIVFFFKLNFVNRTFFALFMILSTVFIFIEKAAVFSSVHYWRKRGRNFRRVVIVGTGRRAKQFIAKIKNHPEWGFNILGLIADEEGGEKSEHVEGLDMLGDIQDMGKLLEKYFVDEVVFIVPRARLNHIQNGLFQCETMGVRASVAMDLFDFKLAKSQLTELDNIPFMTFDTTPLKEWELLIKRGIDIVISGIGIVVLSPLFLVISLLIKLTSPGHVLFLQKRSGMNGRLFVMYKFRTMYKDAQEKQEELAHLNIMKGPVFKVKDDPRITPIGWFLRKFSMDELPQLFNVFIGQMSLVGPRPPIPSEVEKYEPWQRRRLSMRPGITCLWQISGRNKIGFEDWMRLDLEYIDNWSLWLDFTILLKTIPVVLASTGAY